MATGLVIYHAFCPKIQVVAAFNLLQYHISRRTGTDNHDINTAFSTYNAGTFAVEKPQNAVAEADTAGHNRQQEPEKHGIASGHLIAADMA